MKELSIEEKAKAYDDLLVKLQKAKVDNNVCDDRYCCVIDDIVPELKENEDERIRKEMIEILKQEAKDFPSSITAEKSNKWIAWLEKQGKNNMGISEATKRELEDNLNKALEKETPESCNEFLEKQSEQKPDDKVEHKFEIGEWVIYDHRVYQVVELPKEGYINLGLKRNEKIEFAPSPYCRPWTIQDAKDGDVLANDHHILILKELVYEWSSNGTPESVKAYCGIKPNGNFEIGKDNWCFCGTLHIHPATKEQRDTLFAKMKEVGYEWDAEHKQLKKIERKPIEWHKEDEQNLNVCLGYIPDEFLRRWLTDAIHAKYDKPADLPKGEDYGIDGLYAAIDILQKTLGEVDGYQSDDGILTHKCAISAVKELSKQKPAWGEEDEKTFSRICGIIHNAAFQDCDTDEVGNELGEYAKIINWFKSLKDKVQPQPKQEWSEENKKMLGMCIDAASGYYSPEDKQSMKDWLYSLKDRYTWKPSDEQMKVINEVLNFAANHESPYWNDYIFGTLNNLIRQLKKLKA